MNEQKITPKKSEAGIEYIREMRLAGLIKRDIIPADEAVGYEELDRLIQLRKASDLRTIKNWILFFGVMAVIGLCLGGISLFVR